MPSSDASSQTILQDPDNHLRAFAPFTVSSDCNTQTEPCDLEKCCHLTSDQFDDKVTKCECSSGDKADDDGEGENTSMPELQRRLNPTSPQDFDVLRCELLDWRKREERKIAVTFRSAEQKQAMTKVLLNKEACLLRKIDSLKRVVSAKWKVAKTGRIMENTGQPRRWEVGNGYFVVDTVETTRAREMKGMYDELRQKVDKTVRPRIELLQRIKAMMEDMDHLALAKNVTTLLDRELEMLNRGTELGNELLEGLRKRLYNQFAKLVQRVHPSTSSNKENHNVHHLDEKTR
ncbi:predicted protein [Thalassiosira pseudonana CCMP1335]|uniref:IQ motif and ubiquitin-like domain-containing protein n=1 Tax=Thalassiosira pseudonana TaxID=35128 RepID=B8BVM8_THAPS|nr:predicted protein [Thalassiosira pseudonana CCMP1335]EED95488.1 predicted protein [Thalassiosira pseudonana CCMP1335]